SLQVETVIRAHVGRPRHAPDGVKLVWIDTKVLDHLLADMKAQHFAQYQGSPTWFIAHLHHLKQPALHMDMAFGYARRFNQLTCDRGKPGELELVHLR